MTPPPSPRILLIEDDPAVGRSLVEALTEEGFQVTWHTAGRDGLASARQMAPADHPRRPPAGRTHQGDEFAAFDGQ